MHAIEAGEVDDAEMAELSHAPLGEGALESILAHDFHRCHGKNTVVEIHERGRSQPPLDQRTRLQADVITRPERGLMFGKVPPFAHRGGVVRVIFVHERQNPEVPAKT